MTDNLNIVHLIEKNPLTRLSRDYQSNFVQRIQASFTESQQHLFAASFYCYLNHDAKNDFVVDLDNVWKWLGFARKDPAKRVLEKHFTKDVDYKVALHNLVERKNEGGFNKESILMNVNTFKKLCLKAGTKKADEIHDYFLKLEETLHDVLKEEAEELRLQLDQNKRLLIETVIEGEKDKNTLREETLLAQFPKNTQCVYYGVVDNKSTIGESLIKFGNSNDLQTRVSVHKKTYTNFRLMRVFKVANQLHIENEIKKHPELKKKIRSIIIDDKNYRELLAYDDVKLPLDEINVLIKDIIQKNEYNLENFKALMAKSQLLQQELDTLQKENAMFTKENTELKERLSTLQPPIPDEEKHLKKVKFTNYERSGFLLYSFVSRKGEMIKFKCGICRPTDITKRTEIYVKTGYESYYTVNVKSPFMEKIMFFLLRERLTNLGNDTYEGSENDIKLILDCTVKLDKTLTNDNIEELFEQLGAIEEAPVAVANPEVPNQRKSKRPIDQVNKDTGEVVASFDSLEACGTAIGVSGSAVGIAMRNKKLCKGYLFRYAGISREDQYKDQPVVKVCCSNGEKTCFQNIAAAAKDCKISAPGLRNRILTNLHFGGFHWVWEENATHYK
jgi:phage anti-repressor protein